MAHYCLSTGLPCIYCTFGACDHRAEQRPAAMLIKDRGCVRCEKVIDCKGKPQGVTMCINFKERARKNE